MPELALPGCTPEPLMGYLKALGVFRLVAEQADPAATLCWKDGVAHLTSRFDRDGLAAFFLDHYKPTPVMTPWNSASGFAPTKEGNKAPKDKAARDAVEQITRTTSARFEAYRDTIQRIRKLSRGDEGSESWKQQYFTRCRAELPDSVLGWLDSCFALTNDSLPSFPLLGSGGNDGVTDFGSLYMQRLKDVLIEPPSGSSPAHYLVDSLFAGTAADGQRDPEPPPALLQETVGQFNPHRIGGANAVQGSFEAKSEINPWDFVLMIEGVMLFAGSVARRMGAGTDKAAFPFTVESIVVGNGSFCEKEARIQGKEPPNSGELWLPLWKNPVSFAEAKHLFGEGRAQFRRQQARNSVEFALAVCTLGISRGLDSFARYGFLRRNGKAFLATPLGRFNVEPRPRGQLLNAAALTSWLDKLRDACRENDGRKEKVPARYKVALRDIDRAMFEFANRSEHGNDAKYLTEVLAAVGRAERTLAGGLRFCAEKYIKPIQQLNPDWLLLAKGGGDEWREFRLAAALASVLPGPNPDAIGAMRVHLEPSWQKPNSAWFDWSPGSNSAVWSNRPLVDNLAAVFLRRFLESERAGTAGMSLRHRIFAPLADVLAFLMDEPGRERDSRDDRLATLLWGMIGLGWTNEWFRSRANRQQLSEVFKVPLRGGALKWEFAMLRLTTERIGLVRDADSLRVANKKEHPALRTTPIPEPFHRLARGSNSVSTLTEAIRLARRRLWADQLPLSKWYQQKNLGSANALDPHRLLAACLFPLSPAAKSRLVRCLVPDTTTAR